ncbi:MAG: MOSC domain-containing protein [Candidatus Nanopelagicales bacterium]
MTTGGSTDACGSPVLSGALLAVSVGRVGVLRGRDRDIVTAFKKDPVPGPVRLGRLGLAGDEHADGRHHGGPDKAVCVYPQEHHGFWEQRLALRLPASGEFGENFTVTGLVEQDVWLRDVFGVGDALVQVTVPRAPCYKIAARHGEPRLAVLVQEAGYTGYMLRVLREGDVEAGQGMDLVDRAGPGVTVAEANRVLNVDKRDVDGARSLIASGALPEE